MKRYGIWQPLWSIALFIWIIVIVVGLPWNVGYRLSLVVLICAANILMIAADFCGYGLIHVRTGIVTMISMYPVVWRISTPDGQTPGIATMAYLSIYLFILIALASVISVCRTNWVEVEKELVIDAVDHDGQRKEWPTLPPG